MYGIHGPNWTFSQYWPYEMVHIIWTLPLRIGNIFNAINPIKTIVNCLKTPNSGVLGQFYGLGSDSEFILEKIRCMGIEILTAIEPKDIQSAERFEIC